MKDAHRALCCASIVALIGTLLESHIYISLRESKYPIFQDSGLKYH